jgi:hypothetical protein
MLGPDPVVQSPENCQNYNAYAYVLNNPMRFTDPSGYFSVGKLLKKGTRALKKVGKWFKEGYNWTKKNLHKARDLIKKKHRWVKKNYKVIVVVVVAVAATVLTWGAATAWGTYAMGQIGTIAFGAVSGAAMGAAQAAIAGGSWSDILRAGVQGAVTGAITAAVGSTLLHNWGTEALNAWNSKAYATAAGYHTMQSAGHAVVGGGLSELTGGNFKDGFIGAGSAAFLSPVGRGINKSLNFEVEAGARSNGWQYLGRTATAATMGGTVTAISGGKFANGAATAAFMHVVNHEAADFASNQIEKILVERRVAYDTLGVGNMLVSTNELLELFSHDYERILNDSKSQVISDAYLKGGNADNWFLRDFHNRDRKGFYGRPLDAGAGFYLVDGSSDFRPLKELSEKSYLSYEINYFTVGMASKIAGHSKIRSWTNFKLYTNKVRGDKRVGNRSDWFWAGYKYAGSMKP